MEWNKQTDVVMSQPPLGSDMAPDSPEGLQRFGHLGRPRGYEDRGKSLSSPSAFFGQFQVAERCPCG